MNVSSGAREALLGGAEPLRVMLAERGYAAGAMEGYRLLLVSMAGWPSMTRLAAVELTEPRLQRMVWSRAARGSLSRDRAQGCLSLIGKLAELGVVTPAAPNEVDRVLIEFRDYGRRDQRLAELTVRTRGDVLRRFLVWRAGGGEFALSELTVRDVHAFVLHEARRLSCGSLAPVLDAMRSFLRYLFATGILVTGASRISGAGSG